MSANEAKLKSDNAGSLVWDLPLRIFHWALAASLMGSWITAEAGFEWTQTHFLFGYTALGLISFRILWGLVGTTHARFRNFLSGPKAVIQSLKQLPKSTPANGVSHWSWTIGRLGECGVTGISYDTGGKRLIHQR